MLESCEGSWRQLASAAVLAAAGMLSASSIPNLTSVPCRTPERFVFSFSFGFAAEQTFVAICDLLTSPAAAADPDLQRDF